MTATTVSLRESNAFVEKEVLVEPRYFAGYVKHGRVALAWQELNDQHGPRHLAQHKAKIPDSEKPEENRLTLRGLPPSPCDPAPFLAQGDKASFLLPLLVAYGSPLSLSSPCYMTGEMRLSPIWAQGGKEPFPSPVVMPLSLCVLVLLCLLYTSPSPRDS